MALAVSFFDVMSGLIAALAILSAVCFAAMRGQRALAWLATALVIGAVEMQVMKLGGRSPAVIASVSVFMPFAHWCFAQAIRSSLSLGGSGQWRNLAIFALAALSLLLLVTGAGDFLQTLPFQIAGLLAVGDGIQCLIRKRRHAVDYALLLVQTLMATLLILRIPILPVIMGGTTPFIDWTQSQILGQTLTAWALVGPASVVLLIAKVVGGMMAAYRSRAECDDLTGLLNRSAFEQAAHGAGCGTLILCDIDHFKRINDRYGHPVGDLVIRHMAAILATGPGFAARVGGEEFALFMSGASIAEAMQSANAIRRSFQDGIVDHIAPAHAPTASFGVAAITVGGTLADAFAHADAALYDAKREGRNRVALYRLAKNAPRRSVLKAAA